MKVLVFAGLLALQLVTIARGLPASNAELHESLEHFQRLQFGSDKGHHGVSNYHCPSMAPSPTIPTSVHALRPADIKVVAALGDSITAGNGAGAHSIFEVALEYRGMVFSIGGDKDLTRAVTLPNILRKFNPHLFGQSFGIAPVTDYEDSQLNVGVPGARTDLLMREARGLVQRMRTHPHDMNYAQDWKLITIFIGGNDICGYCVHHDRPPLWFRRLNETLDYFYREVPRAIVQLVPILHLGVMREMARAYFACDAYQKLECRCVGNPNITDAQIKAIVEEFQHLEAQLGANGIFDGRDDFTFVVQPFFRNSSHLPTHTNGKPDLGFFAPDCFHFSQRTHQTMARYLWNNMLEPVGSKTDYYDFGNVDQALKCPDTACPYIRTSKNSRNCGHAE